MLGENSPIERTSDALRYVSALTLAVQLVSSDSGRPSKLETDDLVYNLLEVCELIAQLGRSAMEELEGMNPLLTSLQGARHG
ncbi:MAG: hypothetical protein ACK4FP_05045 [Azonexus sp.]